MTREIHIRPVMNGFIVTVGCKTVVFTDPARLTSELLRYYKSPEDTEKDYLATAINKGDEVLACGEAQPPPQGRVETGPSTQERRR